MEWSKGPSRRESLREEMEQRKAEEERLQRVATTRPRNGARPRSSLGLRQHRPKSAMSTLESIYAPHSENRKALHIPRQTKSFDLAIQCGRLFDDVDPTFAPRQARLREKQLGILKRRRILRRRKILRRRILRRRRVRS